ncbi:MAG: hypothetical protein ACJ0GF_05910 [Burkholderiales bacterium]|nr:MAG: hypothetical protein CBB82_07375 [Betaproteobacteria bacterium TMED22]
MIKGMSTNAGVTSVTMSSHLVRMVMISFFLISVFFFVYVERSFAAEDSVAAKPSKGGGLDPTKKKLFLRSEYRKLENDTSSLVGEGLYELPLTNQWYLRMSAPFKRNTALAGGSNIGLGDITTRISYLAINTNAGTRLFFGMENKWDTATDTALGGGKYTFSPVVTGFMRFPEAKIVTFPSVQYVDTAGGDSARADSNNTTIKGTTVRILTDGYYLLADPAFIWDHERNDQSTGTFDLEYGRFVEGKTMYYVRPGTTLWGDSTPFSFKWNIEFGMRIFM